jgi:hypothetical protein
MLSAMQDGNTLLVVPVHIPPQFQWIIIAGLVCMVLGLLWKLSGIFSRKTPPRFPVGLFERADSLLTNGEQAFLPTLEEAVGNRFRIAMKVRLADLVPVRGNGSAAQTARNQVNPKHVDFVLCTNDRVKPVLVIELDDATHRRPDRQSRDAFVDACLESVGLPIFHVPCRRAYDVRQLAADIQARIGRD